MQPKKPTARKNASTARKAPAKRSRQASGAAGKAVDTPLKNGRKGGKAAPSKGAKKTANTGSVYVIQESGIKKVRTHVARKASAHEIRETLGISEARLARVGGMLKGLEKKGLLSKS